MPALWSDFTALRMRHCRRFGICPPDVLIAGTPCQSFSVAGGRSGLDDGRGLLSLQFVELADAVDNFRRDRGEPPCTLVWENVPGVLGLEGGAAFAQIIGRMAGCDSPIANPGRWTDAGVVAGPARNVAWRTLDAQFFGLAQRRKRVFAVASARAGGIDPVEVLLESDRVRGDSAPRPEAAQDVTGTFVSGARGGRRVEWEVVGGIQLARALGTGHHSDPTRDTYLAHTLRAEGFDGAEDGTGRGTPLVTVRTDITHANGLGVSESEVAPSQTTGSPLAVFDPNQITSKENRSNPTPGLCHALPASARVPVAFSVKDDLQGAAEDRSPTMRGHGQIAVAFRGRDGESVPECSEVPSALRASQGGSDKNFVIHDGVRRIMPIEAERLMGFQDRYTAIPGASDSQRYFALGNSMAVPVIAWIGKRLVRAFGRPFTYWSVCAGIEAASAAWGPLGCEALLLSEISRFERKLLSVRHGARAVGRSSLEPNPARKLIGLPVRKKRKSSII